MDTQTMQQEYNPERETHIYDQLILDKEANITQKGLSNI